MATTLTQTEKFTKPVAVLPGRRYDHVFFSISALLMLLVAFLGFARTYYLAGLFNASLPSLTIHLHGAAFSAWVLLLVAQTSLVFSGRTDIHRRLGLAGFLLACLMIVLGVMAATDALRRASTAGVGRDPRAFYIVPLTDMLVFSVFILFAYRLRRDAPSHKRIIYIATTGLLVAAVARLPLTFSFRNSGHAAILTDVFLLALASYDAWSTRRIHRVTLWASVLLIFVQQVRIPMGGTAVWRAFATWVQGA